MQNLDLVMSIPWKQMDDAVIWYKDNSDVLKKAKNIDIPHFMIKASPNRSDNKDA